ncbi:MAG: hypothetical protein M3391_09060 [Actinomycetota bacterium]|nr:hypothetical protein [Actinomycetota bacterium]
MVVAASDLSGWWIGYAIGFVLVAVVVAVVLTIILTARKIADVADDATRALRLTQQRTEALWKIAATNEVAAGILVGAATARSALGGGDDPPPSEALEPVAHYPENDLKLEGDGPDGDKGPLHHSLQREPMTDPELNG